MRLSVRVAAALLTIGWLLPFYLAFRAVMEFEMYRRIDAFLGLRPPPIPFGVALYANILCATGAIWLATAITGWIAYFTRRIA